MSSENMETIINGKLKVSNTITSSNLSLTNEQRLSNVEQIISSITAVDLNGNNNFTKLNTFSGGIETNSIDLLQPTNTLGSSFIKVLMDVLHPIGSVIFTMDEIGDSTTKTIEDEHYYVMWNQCKWEFLYSDSSVRFPAIGIKPTETSDNNNKWTPTTNSGTTGGEAEHLLTTEEMPRHNHTTQIKPCRDEASGYGLGGSAGFQGRVMVDGGINGSSYTGGLNGQTQPHNNIPPYQTVYMYKRIE